MDARTPALAQLLSERMRRDGLSDTELARRLGINRTNVGWYRRGRTTPSESTCDAIAEAFGDDPNLVRRLAGRPLLEVRGDAEETDLQEDLEIVGVALRQLDGARRRVVVQIALAAARELADFR